MVMATLRAGLGVHCIEQVHVILPLEDQSLGNAETGRRVWLWAQNHRGLPYRKHNLVGISIGGRSYILLPL